LRNMAVLAAALEIVEQRLREPMTAEDLAKACYSSCSGLQKLFQFAFCCPVREYITKRRLTCASRQLVQSPASIMDIALEYQYGSPEAFSRAFKRFWGITPSEFRKTRRFTQLHPRLRLDMEKGGISMGKNKPIDVSEFYDELKKLGSSYVLSVDIKGFARINTVYGNNAGDLVLAETFSRLEHELDEGMCLFRTGGDEFAAITGYTDVVRAEALARNIIARNGGSVRYGTLEIPLYLRIGISCLPAENLNYLETLKTMDRAICQARDAGQDIAVYNE
jgi:AraC family transcriptional regulator